MDDEGIIQSGVEANQDSNGHHQSKHRHGASSHRHHHHGNKNKNHHRSDKRHRHRIKSHQRKEKKSNEYVRKQPVLLSLDAHHFRQQSPKDPNQPECIPHHRESAQNPRNGMESHHSKRTPANPIDSPKFIQDIGGSHPTPTQGKFGSVVICCEIRILSSVVSPTTDNTAPASRPPDCKLARFLSRKIPSDGLSLCVLFCLY